MKLRQAVRLPGENAAGEVGDEAVGLQKQDLVGDWLTADELGRGTQGFRQAADRPIVGKARLPSGGERIDEQQPGKGRIGR